MSAPLINARELAYYKRQLETLAGENLKLEYLMSGLRHELKQKRQGFAVLSQLQEAIGAHKEISAIFEAALPVICANLGMDKAVVLVPAQEEHRFRPTQCIGFQRDAAVRLEEVEFVVPAELASGAERLLVHAGTPITPLIEELRRALDAPYLVGVPVVVEGKAIGLLLGGRLHESKPLYPPLDQGDLDTFVAVAGLISASIRNMRVGVLEELDRLKTEFFANISHEFRTPITLTIGPLEQLLRGRYGAINEDVRQQLRVMRHSQERLLALVNQILDLARLEAGGHELKAARVTDPARLIRDLVTPFESVAGERGLAIHVVVAPSLADAEVYVDREKFERVLVNLLSNALKFTKRGSIDVRAEVRSGAFRLTVSDTGIGIKNDQLPHIFDRFRQADGSESREYAGSGIGLALVKEIVELHGGDIEVSSRYGHGTDFRVSLPLGRAHLGAAVVPETDIEDEGGLVSREVALARQEQDGQRDVDQLNRAAIAAFDPARPTVLHAEDNPDLRRYVRDLLSPTYNVFLAADGQDALTRMREYHPDLVLSDQMMPTMSGRELLRAIRADEELRSTPVLFLTARAGAEARVESLEAGADDYLTKPFNEGELLARVRNLIRNRMQERELATLNRRLEARVEEQLGELVRGGELRRFLPRAVAEMVLKGGPPAGHEFERRRITVLCAEITGMTELTEQLEPEELAAIMNEMLREITALAVAHGGTVDRLIANGLVVLFGAPDVMEPAAQASAAADSAFAMRDRMRALRVEWRRRGVTWPLELRAALQTGYCTVGVFGSELLQSYTAVGTPMVVASLLQQDASPGSVVCGVTSLALIEGRFTGLQREPRRLPGMSRPLESYELTPTAAVATVSALPRLRDFSFMPR